MLADVLRLALGQVLVDALEATGGDGHASRADKLQHAAQCLKLLVEAGNVLAHAVHLDDGEHRVHLDDAGTELADNLGHLGMAFQPRRSQLVKGYLVLVDFVVGEVMRLQYVHLLRYLPDHLLDGGRVRPCRDGVLVHSFDGRCGHVQALDVDLSACEHGRDLVEQARHVLRMDDDGI